jgi:monovalent cation:H+ antiporter-2, CPA2 family
MESHVFSYLQSLVTIFGISALLVFALGKIRVPSLVGFLLAGVLIGPSGLDIVKNPGEIQTPAKIGVVALSSP